MHCPLILAMEHPLATHWDEPGTIAANFLGIFVIVLLPPIIVLVPIWFAVYLGSAAFARYRFSRWLDRCVTAWQATSAASPVNPSTPTTSPKLAEASRRRPAVTTSELLNRLANGSFAERLSAIEQLDRSSDSAAFTALRTALGDSDAHVREAALHSLERRIRTNSTGNAYARL